MPELRKDPVLGRWVIISVERGKRPADFLTVTQKRRGGFCPFCPGNEYTTPPEIMAVRPDGSAPNSPGWKIRVMSNKFPALQIEGALNKKGEGLYDMMNGVGAHEVIVETPEHHLTMATMAPEDFEAVMHIYHARITDLGKDPRIKYVLIYKNEGESAGASLEHSHTQLIALPIVPRTVKDELQGARKHFDLRERCIFCDIINQEVGDGRRIIAENDSYIALAPFAPRSPFETWVLPKNHEHLFGPQNGNFKGLTEIFQRVLKQLDSMLDNPSYNFMLHTSPFNGDHSDYYHWHIEILPKLTKIAGFEWGSGFYINPTPPEEAARFMRETGI